MSRLFSAVASAIDIKYLILKLKPFAHYVDEIRETFNSIQFKLVLRLFSVKQILRRDKTRPDTYAIFLGRKKFVIKGTERSGGKG